MSIFVQLGNGENFVFDLGIGSLRNYNSFSIPFNTIDHVFFTHLHMDHMSDLPYFMMFRPIQSGWTPLHIYGPSGSEEQGPAYCTWNPTAPWTSSTPACHIPVTHESSLPHRALRKRNSRVYEGSTFLS
jgi:ribonuclease BN (tRNA processing enzyme)